MKKVNVGYTTGVYDMFHIGHLNVIKRAKEQCDSIVDNFILIHWQLSRKEAA